MTSDANTVSPRDFLENILKRGYFSVSAFLFCYATVKL